MTHTDHAVHTLLWSEMTEDGQQMSRIDATVSAELRERIASCNTSDGWQVIGLQINWEDADLTCSHCGALIESAYGEAD